MDQGRPPGHFETSTALKNKDDQVAYVIKDDEFEDPPAPEGGDVQWNGGGAGPIVTEKSCWRRNSLVLTVLLFLFTAATFVTIGIFAGRHERKNGEEAETSPSLSGDVVGVCAVCQEEPYTPVQADVLPDNQPNIVVLLVDDMGRADFSAGGAEYSTPNIDEIFTDGITMDQVYGMPLCTPSRVALMSGRFTWKVGMQYLEVLHWDMMAGIPTDGLTTTIGDYLKDAGYSNGYFGRWALGSARYDQRPTGRGYDNFVGFIGLLGVSGWTQEAGGKAIETTGPDGVSNFFDVMDCFINDTGITLDNTYNDLFFFDHLMDWLNMRPENSVTGENPWHIFWSPQAMHHTEEKQDPPKVYDECNGTERAYYCNKMKFIDDNLGQLTSEIKRRGEWDNTLIFVMSDNGGAQGFLTDGGFDGEYQGSNWPYRGSKGTFYEGGIRLVTGIGGGWVPEKKRGTVNTERHHVADVAATITDIAQTTDWRRKIMDGVNIFEDDHNDQLVISIAPLASIPWVDQAGDTMGTVAFIGKWKYIAVDLSKIHAVNSDHLTSDMFMTGIMDLRNPQNISLSGYDDDDVLGTDKGWCYQVDSLGAFKMGCLYDIENDPYEQNNLWHNHPDVIQKFQGLIDKEFFGSEYNTGQNMVIDPRAILGNLHNAEFANLDQDGRHYYFWGYPWIGPGTVQPQDTLNYTNGDFDLTPSI